MSKLQKSTQKLNKISDNAVTAVNQTEAFLTECGIGIAASVPIESDGKKLYLAYQRLPSGFRIVVSTGDANNDETRPWGEWDRITKLQTVKKLPELLEIIAQQVAVDTKIAEEAESAITSVMTSTAKKGGK